MSLLAIVDDEPTGCPCAAWSNIDVIAGMLQEPTDDASHQHGALQKQLGLESRLSWEALLEWIGGGNRPCRHNRGRLCRLQTARTIAQAIRNSFPVANEATAVTMKAPAEELEKPAVVHLAKNADSFPPLAVTTKKTSAKRRIRPAMISSSPATAATDTIWGQADTPAAIEATIAWPPPIQSNLLERRLSTTTTSRVDSTSAPILTTPTKKGVILPTPVKEVIREDWEKFTPSAVVCRLVDVYTIIVQACLVHSTAGEVQFVLRLLQSATTKSVLQQPPGAPFLLSSPKDNGAMDYRKDCAHFASLVLTRWSGRLVQWGFASTLADCPPIRQFCPELYKLIQEYLSQSEHRVSANLPRRTAFWTLPFNEMRDSRNRYRTQDELALYKNREDCRDSFLSHLRSFYNQGSSVQLASSKSADHVRKASRSILDALLDDNYPWLAEFFADMLLQIGSVPVQETDKEVLQMADEEKVQKLHQRFKAPARKGRSATGGSGGAKKASCALRSGSRITTVQEEYFRGHQEFFYYFVMLADSHRLNHHLRHQFMEKIDQTSSNLSTSNMDRHLEDLCLLARFLGLLILSPNWHSSRLLLGEGQSRSLAYDELLRLRFGGEDVDMMLRKAWRLGRMASVVPWLVEMLRMSVWDEVSRRTESFRQIACHLRQIQLRLKSSCGVDRISPTCREFLLLYMESFADEIAGLESVESLLVEDSQTLFTDNVVVPGDIEYLDQKIVMLEGSTIIAASGRVEGVLSLVMDLTRSSRGLSRSSGVTRKVRPSFVAGSAAAEEHNGMRPVSLPATRDRSKIQNELRQSFFHLHRDLREICNFSLERVEKSLFDLFQEVDVDMHVHMLATLDESVDWVATQQSLLLAYEEAMKTEMVRCLGQSIDVFSPGCNEDVKRIATSVALEQGMQAGQPKVESAVSEALATAKTNHERAKRKKIAEMKPVVEKGSLAILCTIVSMLRKWTTETKADESDIRSMLLETLQEARNALIQWVKQDTRSNVPEEDLRSFYCAIAEFDLACLPFVRRAMNSTIGPSDWLLLSEIMRVAALSSSLCSHGLQSVKNALNDSRNISTTIASGLRHGNQSEIADLVGHLCQTRILPSRFRQDALRQVEKAPTERL
jgi:hypothetical protein